MIDQLKQIEIWGGYNLSAYRMAVMLSLTSIERTLFVEKFNDLNSSIRLAWEKGRTQADLDIMESLDTFAQKEEEGSGEAAEALGALKKRQTIIQLKKDLFGV